MGITQQKASCWRPCTIEKFLTRFIAQKSDLILTHATEGVKMIEAHYPYAAGKIHFLHHPTKNRLPESLPAEMPKYDILIWGNISPYKGVLEYLSYLKNNPQDLKVCIIGKCSPNSLANEIRQIAPRTSLLSVKALHSRNWHTISGNRRLCLPLIVLIRC